MSRPTVHHRDRVEGPEPGPGPAQPRLCMKRGPGHPRNTARPHRSRKRATHRRAPGRRPWLVDDAPSPSRGSRRSHAHPACAGGSCSSKARDRLRRPRRWKTLPCWGRPVRRPNRSSFQVRQSAAREHPDPATIILEEGLRRVIRQSTGLVEGRGLSVLPPGQASIVGRHPDAPIHGGEHRSSRVAGQALFRGNRSDGELSKPVESSGGGDPDIVFTILEKAAADVAGEPV